ncbi:hypothetical protein DMUE_3156 [Dictyocoela muelleri]|nr:hypothetical protein DMUE_3156 [Dictyocoela muelleri]
MHIQNKIYMNSIRKTLLVNKFKFCVYLNLSSRKYERYERYNIYYSVGELKRLEESINIDKKMKVKITTDSEVESVDLKCRKEKFGLIIIHKINPLIFFDKQDIIILKTALK